MTKTHAMGSGVSHGMRYLLRMIFNFAVDQDDDGNAAGYKTRGYVPASTNGAVAKNDADSAAAQRDIEVRRAAVQLRNALPQMVVEPPRKKLTW